ncbi:hypothetical protein Tco_0078168 [Tanacetum coccineum]
MRNSPAYKTYLAFATRAATPKKARKFKKPASPSKKIALVAVKEPTEKPVKKPAARRQSAGVQIRDTPSVSVSRRRHQQRLKEAKGGSSEGANSKSEVPDEQRGKSTDTGEGTDLKPGVVDVSKADSSKSEYESWGDSDDDNNDDDQQSDDERTKSDNSRTSDDEEETQEDEFVHTPEDYVPTDDENVDDEEYDRINKEMYDDVNVKFKDTDEGKEYVGNPKSLHFIFEYKK